MACGADLSFLVLGVKVGGQAFPVPHYFSIAVKGISQKQPSMPQGRKLGTGAGLTFVNILLLLKCYVYRWSLSYEGVQD